MAKNRMSDLRDHLFVTLEALADNEKPMDLDRAKTVCEVAQTIINSAKVEVDLLRTIGSEQSSEFFEARKGERLLAASHPLGRAV